MEECSSPPGKVKLGWHTLDGWEAHCLMLKICSREKLLYFPEIFHPCMFT
jgi:hypothetical protein